MRFLMLILLLYHTGDIYAKYHCDVRPRGASGAPNENDGKFIIEIATTPEKYIPDQTYNVTLRGKSSVLEEPIQFNGFSITVQPSNMNEISPILDPNIAGVLEVFPGDSTAKIDEKCPNMVIQTSHIFVSEVVVQWKAPPPERGCIILRASVMEQNVWYRNDRGLMTEICEDDNAKSDGEVEPCGVCNEAKYELNFEGMWTRQSHPLYFPSNVWSTRFSDVIGASHGTSYRFWKEGDMPSTGLIEFLNSENTTTLETEIKSNETRTVIKAKGLRYPNITGKTFAVFRVDKDHHLLSIISLIIPSPDWFVGVSGLDLCNKTEWIPDKIIDLYPYDLGLYSDLQYTSKSQPSNDSITKIDHATEYASPFHTNNTEKLKPLARIHLIRSRIYERVCSEDSTDTVSRGDNGGISYTGGFGDANVGGGVSSGGVGAPKETNPCYISPKIDWSSCSIPECDPDRVKGRFPDWSDEDIKRCVESGQPIEALKTEGCSPVCTSKSDSNTLQRIRQLAPKCPTTPWTPFSKCDPDTCKRTRTRTLIDNKNINCWSMKTFLEQTIKCSVCVTTNQQRT